jgi:23S rRNA (uracil1939-C5)-methyltransferase
MTMYRRVEQIAGPAAPSAVAWDLYCGIGQMSLVLARLGYKVLGVEENPKSIEDAADNARRNRLDKQSHFLAARVEDVKDEIPTWASSPELVVVNPSRRGLAEVTREELADLLASRPRTRLVYVSCSVDSLARDLKDLTEKTGFRVRQVEAFDMFAQTDGLEWLVVLTH